MKKGDVADLVVLNPLDDIRHTRAIDQVVVRGKIVNRAAIDRLLKP